MVQLPKLPMYPTFRVLGGGTSSAVAAGLERGDFRRSHWYVEHDYLVGGLLEIMKKQQL